MNANYAVNAFLSRHNFTPGGPNINNTINSLLFDMEEGLKKEPLVNPMHESSMDMIPTWTNPPLESPKNEKVIVIDAGGTNFRSCLVNFDENGIPSIEDIKKTLMVATDREFSKKEFFDSIASNLDHLKNKANRIGFCFSYPMKITPEGDGEVIQFSKEIKAKEVIGSLVGENLAQALEKRGWNKLEKITLLNDTVAALLAGATTATNGKKYSSYIGFILGTGMNIAYIEREKIEKIKNFNFEIPDEQIIVTESGKSNKVAKSNFDIELDKNTNSPGLYAYEKMCSGAYLGSLALIVLKTAAEENFFSEKVKDSILKLDKLDLKDMDQFLYKPFLTNTKLGAIVSLGNDFDSEFVYRLLDSLVERSAKLASALIAANVIKSKKGNNPAKPVCILCEGTTFIKTYNLKNRVVGYLNTILNEQHNLWFELITLDNAVTLGSAIAGLL